MTMQYQKAASFVLGFRDIEGSDGLAEFNVLHPLAALVDEAGFIGWMSWYDGTFRNVTGALSDCPITYQGITLSEYNDAQATWGTDESERRAKFRFVNEDGRPSFLIGVPGPLDAILSGNRRDINLTNAAVAAFITEMTTGTIRVCDANGIPLKTVLGDKAYVQTRASSGGSGRRTG